MEHRVLVVDAHPLFRAGLVAVLERDPRFSISSEAANLDEALAALASNPTDLAVASDVHVIRALRTSHPSLHVLAVADPDEPVRIVELLRAGATGFAHKSQSVEEFLEAINDTLAARRYIAPNVRSEIEEMLSSNAKLPAERLTGREREVFGLLVRGYSNALVSTQLGIAPRTVETHRQRVLKKLDAHSVADLVRLAAKWGVELH